MRTSGGRWIWRVLRKNSVSQQSVARTRSRALGGRMAWCCRWRGPNGLGSGLGQQTSGARRRRAAEEGPRGSSSQGIGGRREGRGEHTCTTSLSFFLVLQDLLFQFAGARFVLLGTAVAQLSNLRQELGHVLRHGSRMGGNNIAKPSLAGRMGARQNNNRVPKTTSLTAPSSNRLVGRRRNWLL